MFKSAEKLQEGRNISQQAEPREEFCNLTAAELDAISGGARDGLYYLIHVTQMKANN